MRLWLSLASLCGMLASGAAHACSQSTPCTVGERDYYIALPETGSEAMPSVVYIHGWGGSGSGALRNTGMVSAFLERGYAVIAPDGVPRQGANGRTWGFHPLSGRQMSEVAFLEAVRDDALGRFDLDPDRVMLAGFSIGGSMTAYTACLSPDSFAAYAPLGGNFWRPHPTECAGPVRMLHTHGWNDGTVPLEGRAVNGLPADDPEAFVQGDIFYALSIWRAANGCQYLKADRFVTDGPFWRRIWDRCSDGSALEFALYPGGHSIPGAWPELVVDWFDGLQSE
ncbi:alpha/beta hydrolase family esterase [Cognatiyoonia sp. IB215182]|uniref:alpha/beta hydrolase family esterase n=1 Tax=Cognatiyoonia sp. IB215182 TaxID=3097353 RepID=UPI002A172390|nr:alpha/beta fold hydrolase [Cognatiyoonia sp. IB215182]MDX8352494.1 alpha/beta fold hydrolase [Cognatiyoonia sp. IB215182]